MPHCVFVTSTGCHRLNGLGDDACCCLLLPTHAAVYVPSIHQSVALHQHAHKTSSILNISAPPPFFPYSEAQKLCKQDVFDIPALGRCRWMDPLFVNTHPLAQLSLPRRNFCTLLSGCLTDALCVFNYANYYPLSWLNSLLWLENESLCASLW